MDAPVPAYEWWYFDALSDDGRDALVVIFLSNFIFSPRYNRMAMESLREPSQANNAARFPALAVCFYRDGRPLFRALNEYAGSDFQSGTTEAECRIGRNTFSLRETAAGSLYELHIETTLRRKRQLQARLTWTVREGNFFEEEREASANASTHHWNMVAPRCDVSGEVTLTKSDGERSFNHIFKGTGYHDHNWDRRWMPAIVAEWQWGRIHFPAATAVFYRYRERHESEATTRLYLIQDNLLSTFTPQFITDGARRHHFGLRYPQLMQLLADPAGDGPTLLRVRQSQVIDSSFFYLRFLSEATLETIDGRVQQASGLTEHLAPRSLSYPWLWWLINMRIGNNGRGAFLP